MVDLPMRPGVPGRRLGARSRTHSNSTVVASPPRKWPALPKDWSGLRWRGRSPMFRRSIDSPHGQRRSSPRPCPIPGEVGPAWNGLRIAPTFQAGPWSLVPGSAFGWSGTQYPPAPPLSAQHRTPSAPLLHFVLVLSHPKSASTTSDRRPARYSRYRRSSSESTSGATSVRNAATFFPCNSPEDRIDVVRRMST